MRTRTRKTSITPIKEVVEEVMEGVQEEAPKAEQPSVEPRNINVALFLSADGGVTKTIIDCFNSTVSGDAVPSVSINVPINGAPTRIGRSQIFLIAEEV